MCSAHQRQDLTVIVIDDNEDHLALMTQLIESTLSTDQVKARTIAYENPAEALVNLSDLPNQVILMDYQLQESTGVEWLSDFVNAGAGPVLLVTSSGDEKIAVQAFRAGAADYVLKSEVFKKPSILERSIKESLRKYRLESLNQELSRQLKAANKDLNSKNRKLTELTESAHRFVEDVAHEFRTPLAVIKEFASIIVDGLGGEVTPKQLEFLNHITGSAGDLAGLIDDFLNSSRLRSNSIRVDRRSSEVGRVIDTVRPMLQSRAASNSITLSIEIDDDLPEVFVDADKMQRSLINLVVNAIKFSDKGSEVRVCASVNNEHSVRISVQDYGAGLAQDSVKDLFNRFNQGGANERRLASGFGLGLNIVKEMVAINLGSVDIVSELGEGSTFSFTVPNASNESVVHEYLEHSFKRSEDPLVTVIAVERKHREVGSDELVNDLKRLSYPMDLVFVSEEIDQVYLMGYSEDVEAWVNRLSEADLNAQRQSDDPRSSLVMKVCGSWDPKRAEPYVLGLLESPIQGGSSYASISVDS
ncbi:MAG: response regulator [Phycisphaerales bacterium]|nr:response regulator [Phycisphaerales bacterium]